MDSAVPATQNEIFEIAVDVTAYGGALPIESVVSTLTMPADATLEYVTIGGESAETELGATLGTMNSGETQTVVYGVRCSTLGVKGFSVDITSTLIYSAYDYIEKVIHRPSATISDILVVNGGDAEHDALEAKLGWMGYSYTSVSVQDVIDNGISTSHKQVVIHNNTTSMPDAFLDGSFHDRLTDYLDAGGNVVLFGNAVELLDVSGITNEMFNQYSNNHRIYITSVNHPITEEYSAGNYLSMGGNTYVSYVSAPDPTIGMVTLGYFYTSSINMLGEVPYGTGKVIFCGAATFTTPSNDFLGLATRIVDYGQLRILRPMFELNGTEFPTNSQVDVTMRLYDEDSSLVTADSLESYYRDSEFNSFDVEFIESDSTGVYEASFLIEHDYPSGNYEIYVSAYKENMASGSGSVGFNVYSTLIVDSLLISYNLEPSVLGPNTPFTVYGTVRDYHEGNPLPAEVIISITDTMGVEYTSEDTIASEAGEYNFSLVSPNEYGNYSILLSAIYDYGIQGTQQLPVLVVVNPAPYFTNAYLPESPEDDTLNINLQDYVEDADSPDSSFAFSVLNGVGMFQYELLDNSLVIIPAADWFGSDSIEIGVTDGTYSTSQYLYFDISPVNDPPESFILLTPENGLIVNHPDSVALTFTWAEAFDIDSENLHYTLSITDSASFDSLFTITDIMELRMNIEDLPRNAPLFWSVIVSDGEYENTSNLTHSFSIDAMVGTVPPIQIPDSYCLEQNFPNPFNPSTTLRYGLPEDANVSLIIYDIRGNLVNMIVSETQAAGWYEHVWNGLDQSGQQVSTGLYLTRLQAGSDNRTIKMLYLK